MIKKKASESGSEQDVTPPDTGDHSGLFSWISVMAIAAAGMAGVLLVGKKRKVSRR